MKLIKYICDNCGAEIEGDYHIALIEEVDRVSGDYVSDTTEFDGLRDKHFCLECSRKLLSIALDGFGIELPEIEDDLPEPVEIAEEIRSTIEELYAEESEGDEGASEKKSWSRKRKEIDVPKVKALYDAGWSTSRIAKEMKVSRTVVDRIRKEKGLKK